MAEAQIYEIGKTLEYQSSVPFKDRNKFDGVIDRIYIVDLVAGKTSAPTRQAIVRFVIKTPLVFDYEEDVPSNKHIVQAIKNPANGKISLRLLTGQAKVHGRVVFKTIRHYKVLTVRSRDRWDRYLDAVKVIKEDSPGPHRLVNAEGTKFTFKAVKDGEERTIEFIRGAD